MIVTVAVALEDELACEVAVTVTVGVLGIVLGAVKRPLFASMLPHEVTPDAQVRLHMTAVSVEPRTIAANC
jgi:hypothetical protein